MAWMAGASLQEELSGWLDTCTARAAPDLLFSCYPLLQIIAPLLRVLEKMHRCSLMHRDIKVC